jgi:hypothetical protein
MTDASIAPGRGVMAAKLGDAGYTAADMFKPGRQPVRLGDSL